MIPLVCDRPDRIPARIFLALKTECPCCTFWRGAALGAAIGSAVVIGTMVIRRRRRKRFF